jgi:hypothetical protein
MVMTLEQRDEFLGTLFNPRYTNPEHEGPVLLDGIFNGQTIQFFASPFDMMEYGRKIHARVLAGEYGEIGPYEPPPEIEKPAIITEEPIRKDVL